METIEEKFQLPSSNYTIVTWDMVVTGGSLYDDMCHLQAYVPGQEPYSQHVMPYNNMSLSSRRRHGLNVISSGRHRVLKDLRNNKVLKTKSAFETINDFITWLSNVKGSSEGIILVNHDTRDLIACILMEVVRAYNLQDLFQSIVKGFGNGFHMAEAKCEKSVQSYSMRALCGAVLSAEEQTAMENVLRSQSIYSVLSHLFGEQASGGGGGGEGDHSMVPNSAEMVKNITSFCYNVDRVVKMCNDLKSMETREESLQPLFNTMRTNRSDRQRSFNLQRLLARSNIDYTILSDIYAKGGVDAINEVLKCTMAQEHARELDELKHIFAMHFDPEYKGEFKPAERSPNGTRPSRSYRRNSRGRRPRRNSKTPSSPETENPTKTKEGETVNIPSLTVTNDKNETQPVVNAAA